jgi:hypothetical protein
MSYSVVVLLLMGLVSAGEQQPASQQSAGMSPREIADKALQAHGGAEKLSRLKATMATVHSKLHGPSGTAIFTGQSAEGADRQWYDYNTIGR